MTYILLILDSFILIWPTYISYREIVASSAIRMAHTTIILAITS